MKNKKILGIPIIAFVIGLVVLGGASAALVSYLSNTTTSSVKVTSPFLLYNAEGHVTPTSTTDTPDTGWTDGGNVDFGSIVAGEKIEWTNKIRNDASVDIAVNDVEYIFGEDNDEQALTMDKLEDQFTFFGARYWRAQGSELRVADYNGDVEKGWAPYTYNHSGTIECYDATKADSVDTTAPSTSANIAVYDGICYYVGSAFDFELDGTDLVSNYTDYTYQAYFEEIAQYVAQFNPATTPGTYHYNRMIEPVMG